MPITHNFELVQEQAIPELNTHAQLFRHTKTGTEVLSLQNDDENKAFGIVFYTPPSDSTGLPHIMEHSVLCGSRKYPVKEPFVELLKGSLKTFVNAMTSPDKTTYPLASQNLQDFYNLIDVYLDAVFYPNLTPYTLLQEGWHYELDSLDSPLVFKGVVFNEMKGAYSDPESLLERHSKSSLFPDTLYGHDAGGDPSEIPNLTYEQFKRFHERYYHPSNARVFFCGDDLPEERLRIMDAWLSDFDTLHISDDVTSQIPFQAPRQLTYHYATGPGKTEVSKRGLVTVNWALVARPDIETILGLDTLEHILIGIPASPLRKALIDSGLGEDLTGHGLRLDLVQPVFSTGLKGIRVQDAQAVETLILDTLGELAVKGIDADMIEASINTIEFELRENNTGSFPRGLWLGWKTLRTWLYGGDPFEPLMFETPLNAIKDRLASGERYFENLIRSYLLENDHRTTVILKPDPDLQQRQEAAEKERLARARAAMGEAELMAVMEDTRELKRIQETPDPPDALATIPTLQRKDLDPYNKVIPLAMLESNGTPVLFHDLFTNGVVYLDLGMNVHLLPQAYLPYMGLFGRALLEMGTQTEDFVKLSQRIGRHTGGIDPTKLSMMKINADEAAVWGMLRGKATTEKAPMLLAILRDILLTTNFDNQHRFRQLVLEEKATREAMLVPRGHVVVRNRLQAQFNEADWFGEQISGISYLDFLRELVEKIDHDWPAVLNDLETVRQLLVNRQAMICNVTLDAPNWTVLEPQLGEFLGELPAAEPVRQSWNWQMPAADEGLIIPAQVNYVGKGANLYDLGYTMHGSILGITNYLRATWLWERVRVHGGAYGGFVTFDRRSGAYAYLSYRDPNVLETIKNYDQTARFLRNLDLSEDELTKVIIGAIGILDDYQLPDAKGYTSLMRYLTGDSDEKRQQMRDEVLGMSLADFHAFADIAEQVKAQGTVVVMGSQEAIDHTNSTHVDWLKTTKVL